MKFYNPIFFIVFFPLISLILVSIFIPIEDSSIVSIIYSLTLLAVTVSQTAWDKIKNSLNKQPNYTWALIGFFSMYLLDKYLPILLGDISKLSNQINNITFFISTVILAPIAEELAFREVLYQHFKNKFSTYTSIIAVNIIWTFCHFDISLTSIVSIFISGIILCKLRDKYNLATAIIAHLLINLYYFGVTV